MGIFRYIEIYDIVLWVNGPCEDQKQHFSFVYVCADVNSMYMRSEIIKGSYLL